MAISSVNRRLASDSQRKDLLGRLLEELEQGVDSKGRTLDIKDIQTEAFGFIVAGSHTTAATSILLLWHLFHNPPVLAKLRNEIDTLQDVEGAPPCYPFSVLANLPYLQATVSENYRISPVFVMPLMRVVPEGGKVIAGEFVPAGTDVSICNYALHHDPEVFGPDLERFDPDRWLNAGYNKAGYLMPFGAGHRACIGRNIATTEIYKLIVSLLARYDLEYLPADGEMGTSIPKTRSFGVADLEGSMMVKVRMRG
jgi:cytochrome P450